MKKNYTFKTQRGAQIELTVNIDHITTESINLDGYATEVKADKYNYKVDTIKVNGNILNGEFYNYQNTEIKVGMQGSQPILVAIPEEIRKDFMAEEIAKNKQKLEKMIDAERKYSEHREMMKKAMSE